ncbi:hypothetical protein NSQ96_15385 [Caldifermentibacillus hisashii]|uniref:hypothetical protein n=1 Tax=Caldifermentibacillus hisashii TaxID=996558 RepID=UPI0031FC4EEE
MSKQDELNAIFKRIAGEHGKLTAKQVEFAIREIGRVRGDIADMLADYAGADGVIKRSRLLRLLRELETVEQSLRQYGTDALNGIIEESADIAIEQVRIAFHRVLSESLNTVSLNQNVIDYVATRFSDDGLVLSDRIWTTSGVIRDAIATQLRSDIIKGESVGTMVKNVRKVYDNQTWMIKRLVVTESNTAYRTANAMSIERSEVADWVRIVDNGSRHPRHKHHKCYILAHEDRYGRGRGIFKPNDSEIYCPHPQCSSYIVPVLKSEYL